MPMLQHPCLVKSLHARCLPPGWAATSSKAQLCSDLCSAGAWMRLPERSVEPGLCSLGLYDLRRSSTACLQNVGRALEGEELSTAPSAQGVSNEDPTYRLLVDCNQLSVDIDGEIAIVHNFMKARP